MTAKLISIVKRRGRENRNHGLKIWPKEYGEYTPGQAGILLPVWGMGGMF
jgi:hypothetical protein